MAKTEGTGNEPKEKFRVSSALPEVFTWRGTRYTRSKFTDEQKAALADDKKFKHIQRTK